MEERHYVKVGNCYVNFAGIWHVPMMKADYRKATPFLDKGEAKREADERLRGQKYKIVLKKL